MRWVWREEATEAVIEDTSVGSRSSRRAWARVGGGESVGQESEGEEGGPGPALVCIFLCLFPLSLISSPLFGGWREAGG